MTLWLEHIFVTNYHTFTVSNSQWLTEQNTSKLLSSDLIPEPLVSMVTSLTSWKWSRGVTLLLDTTLAMKGCCRENFRVEIVGVACPAVEVGLAEFESSGRSLDEGELFLPIKVALNLGGRLKY